MSVITVGAKSRFATTARVTSGFIERDASIAAERYGRSDQLFPAVVSQ